MEDFQVISSQDNNQEEQKSSGKVFIVIGIVALLLIIAGLSYFLGSKSRNNTNEEISTTSEEASDDNISDEIVTATNTPTPTKKISLTPTPTVTSTPTPSPTPTPILKTKILSSTATLDGFRSSNGGGNATVDIRAGRNVNLVTRGFVSFDLSEIPAGAVIKEATLRLYQAKIIGNPYGVGGSLKLDHLTYGDSLDNSDYAMAALSSSFTTLTSNSVIEWKDADVTDRLKDDLSNARSRSQYRLHFQTENIGGDITGDFTYFESADNSLATGNTPQLVIKYY